MFNLFNISSYWWQTPIHRKTLAKAQQTYSNIKTFITNHSKQILEANFEYVQNIVLSNNKPRCCKLALQR